MHFNITAEYASLVIILILVVYSHEYNLIPTLKNKLFRVCLFFTMFSIISSIASVISIENRDIVPMFMNQLLQTIYFLSAPLIAVFFFFYIIAVIWDEELMYKKVFMLTSIPYMLYAVMVLSNPFTGFLAIVTDSSYFAPGIGYDLAFIVPGLYVFAMISVILVTRRKTEKQLRAVLLSFPLISILMLLMQWVDNLIVVSGLAATSSLLIIYLYLQNKQTAMDDLTGLQNRKTFTKVLEIKFKKKLEMEIILINIDNFKVMNDRMGHLFGNNLLKAISQYLCTVVPIKSVYRFGGDEFIIILDKSMSNDSKSITEKIRERFSMYWDFGELHHAISMSIAQLSIPQDVDKFDAVIALLEYCIDLSKNNGKNKTIICNKEIVEKLKRKNQIISRINVALRENTFQVFYQPIYSSAENRFMTAEALLRFTDSELGVVSPAEFIPIAEETGQIMEIGEFVISRVIEFIQELTDAGVDFDTVSVNLSPVQMMSEKFIKRINDILLDNHLIAQKLSMEITENIFIENSGFIDLMMIEFKKHGVRFYLDDFGTGYSNIARIISLPFEFIKIDKSILYDSIINPKSFSVLKGLCKTFSDTGMKIVIEGVENLEQAKLAASIHVDHIQGYIYARPVPAAVAVRYLGRSPEGYAKSL